MNNNKRSPKMSNDDIRRFRERLARHLRGEFTPQEIQRAQDAKKVYDEIIKNHGGKNPILGY